VDLYPLELISTSRDVSDINRSVSVITLIKNDQANLMKVIPEGVKPLIHFYKVIPETRRAH
jgi:hypothetical protein